MRRSIRALVFLLAAGCGGAASQGTPAVTVTAQPVATAPPATTGSLPQPTTTSAATPPRPTALPGTSIRFEGGAGTSVKDAIVIKGAHGEMDGVAAEYKYLELIYGPRNVGYTVSGQSLLSNAGKSFDELDIAVNGKPMAVYFDITDYFGKM